MMKLIDKDALKKDVLDLPNCYNGFSDTFDKACIIGLIDEQPTIEVPKLIPCSERLPEEDPTFYVAPDERTSRFVIATVIGMTHPHSSPRTLIARYSYTANRWVIRSSNIGNVIAWMPLPQPYKEADNE